MRVVLKSEKHRSNPFPEEWRGSKKRNGEMSKYLENSEK
jgi:hypothetical protein